MAPSGRTVGHISVVALCVAASLAACSDDGNDTAPVAESSPTTEEAATTDATVTGEPTEATDPPASTAGSTEPQEQPTGLDLGADVPAEVTNAIEGVVSKDAYRHSTWGVTALDEATGEVLVDLNSETMFVPGSIVKTISSAGVLEALGPDHTFTTPVYADGTVSGGVLDGNLILVASGGDYSFGLRDRPDGTLEYSSLPDIDHNEANAGLGAVTPPSGNPTSAFDSLAQQVVAAGVTSVSGDVVIDDRIFETYEGWLDGPIAPIWFNENVVDITVVPGAAPGDAPTITLFPETAAFTLQPSATTVASGQAAEDITATLAGPGVLEVSGDIEVGGDAETRIYVVEDPVPWARTGFVEALQRAGVAVTASPTGPNPTSLLPDAPYAEAAKLAEHTSATLAELVKVILKVSFNRGADLLVCLTAVAAGSTECPGGVATAMDTVTALGIGESTAFVYDGAGSDDHNRLTPGGMTEFLRGASGATWAAEFEDGLPILGEDGTLAMNQTGTAAAGNVRAKTGTRIGVTPDGRFFLTGLTQVGYIDAASGRRLTYAVMVNNVPLAEVLDFFDSDADQGAIAAALQANY